MPTRSHEALAASLAHVLWIGGATDSGKSSVAQRLAAAHGFQVYHYDQFDREAHPGHWARADPERHPFMCATRIADPDWMWVNTTPQELVERWLRTVPERFELTLEDLLSLPTAPPIVAEGYGFTPDLVLPLVTSPRQAIWLISTEAFKRASYERRGKGAFTSTSDPLRARQNHIGRDLLLAAHIMARSKHLQAPVMEIDGTQSVDEVVSLVEAHFAPFIERPTIS